VEEAVVEEATVVEGALIMTIIMVADCPQVQKNVIRATEHAPVQRAMERVRVAYHLMANVLFVVARGYASIAKAEVTISQ
jgi:hypothetical protein